MGAVASVVTAVAVVVVGIVKAIQIAFEDHKIRDNPGPVFEENTRRVERDECDQDTRGLSAVIEAARMESAQYKTEAEEARQGREKAEDARMVAETATTDARAARAGAERQLCEGIRPIILPI